MKRSLLLFSAFICCHFSLFAQIALSTDGMTVESGQTIDVPVRVNGFTDVIAMQFSVRWDPTVLEFIEIKDFDLPSSSGDLNFNTNNSFNGILTFLWFDQSAEGIDKPGDAIIFNLSFLVIGQPGDTTTVAIANDPALIEVVDINGEMSYTIDNGLVTIEDPNHVEMVAAASVRGELFQNQPNPFSLQTRIDFDIWENSGFEFRIFNNFGQILYEFQNKSGTGTYNLTIDRSLFPTTGIYYYALQTDTGSVVKKLHFVE